jgi:hypothetical protein
MEDISADSFRIGRDPGTTGKATGELHDRLVLLTRSAITVVPGGECPHFFSSLIQFNTTCSDVGPFWSADFISKKRLPSVS